MDIKKVILKNNVMFGFVIEDAQEDYPIIAKQLHTTVILDQLLSDGWQLFGLPYDLRKGDVKAEELPSITYSEAGLNEDEEQYLMDMCVDVYTEVELKSKLCKEVALAHMKFKDGSDKIKTRSELIQFLDSLEEGFDIDSEVMYMPLNSFVSKSALFSVDEYFAALNAKYRRIIESRRKISLRNHMRLLKTFNALGLPSSFTAKEFIDMYMSWGVCGIDFLPYDKQQKDSNLIFGSTVHYDMPDESMPYLRERILTYLKTDRSFHIPTAMKGSKLVPYDSDSILEEKARANMLLGMNYISPIIAETRITEQVTTFIGESLTVMYNTEQIAFINEDGRRINISGYSVVAPYGRGMNIRHELWNLLDPEVKIEFFEEAYLRSLEQQIISNSTENVQVSSIKALRSTGVGIRPALKYMLMSDSLIDTAFETIYGEEATAGNEEEKRVMIDNDVHDYLEGQIPYGTRKYDSITELLENIIAGITNIDMVETSSNSDRSTSTSIDYFNHLKVARKYLGISLQEISDIVSVITKDSTDVEFHSQQGSMRMRVFPRKMKRKGYIADRNNYMLKAAMTATNYHYITEVYREVGPKGKVNPNHCAVRALEFYTEDGRATTQVIEWIKQVIDAEIQKNIPFRQMQKMRDTIPALVPGAIFEALIKGTISIPKTISDSVIPVPQNIIDVIAKNVEEKLDSIYAFQEMAIIKPRDGWFHYITNADIIGDNVIPKRGFTILEKPLPPIWEDSRKIPAPVKQKWVAEGYVENMDYRGFSPFYKRTSIINFDTARGAKNPLDEPLSLPAYWAWINNYKDTFPLDCEFVKPRESYYIGLYEPIKNFEGIEFDMEEDTEEGYNKLPAPVKLHMFGLDPVVKLTREIVFQRHPELVSFFEIKEALPAPDGGVRPFMNYSVDDFLYFGTFDEMHFDRTFDKDRMRPFAVFGEYLHFPDGRRKYTEIPHLDPSKYAVEHIRDRKYMVEDLKGQLWEVIV